MSKILIKNGYVLTMEQSSCDGRECGFLGDIVIHDKMIVDVCEAGQKCNLGTNQGYEVIDASGMIVLPGLINCHTHAAMTLLRGYADDLPLMEWLEEKIWPFEAKLTPESIYWGTQLAILEMIKGGTTCFADMYFMEEEVARAVDESGIRASLSRGLIAANNGEKALVENVAFAKKWNNGADGRITTMLGPHSPYTCPPSFLKEVLVEAKKLAVGIHIHLAETKSEVKQIQEQYHSSPVEMAYDAGLFAARNVVAAHCVYASANDIKLMLEGNVGVAHNPESNMKLASGVAPVVKFLENNVPVGLGTDGAASNNNLDMIQEMRSCALLQKVYSYDPTVISSTQALHMATKGGAKVLGLEKQVGGIKQGMKADLILINLKEPHLHPAHDLKALLVYSAMASDVHTVIVDGKLLMLNREVKTLDEERILAQVNNITKKLLES